MIFSLYVLKIPQIFCTVGLILCIVAATSATNIADIQAESTLHIGIILYVAAFGILVALIIGAAIARHSAGRGEGLLIAAVAGASPFILVRLIYSVVAAFGHDSSFNIVTGSVTLMLGMAVLEEFVVVAIYTITGIKLEVVPKDQSGSAGQNMIYRAGRGDFGMNKLGLVSLLIAAVRELANLGRTETRQQQEAGFDKV